MLLRFVTSEQAKQITADYVERSLFKTLLALGRQLLTLFFVIRSKNCCQEAVQSSTSDRLAYQQNKKRTYYSIFGKVPL